MRSICVFCGASPGNRELYRIKADAVGKMLAQSNIRLVYGAGKLGLMGIVADAALNSGGNVVGVIPQGLVDKEKAHTGLSELFVVDSMHTRKAMMANLSDAFITLPGGYGTLEEMMEIFSWNQLSFMNKPIGVLNVDGYFDGLLQFLDHAVNEGFLHPKQRADLIIESDEEILLQRLKASTSVPSLVPDVI